MNAETVYARQKQIMADRDYRLQLILTLAEKHPEIIDAAAMADSRNWMSALSNLHAALSAQAFEMAVGEWKVKDALAAYVPNNVATLGIRRQA